MGLNGFNMKLLTRKLAVLLGLIAAVDTPAVAAEVVYPQVVKTRYEAVDQKVGGQFVLWSEREKIFYRLELFPGARFVEVTQVTPTVGSITLTYIEVRTVASQTSDYLYLTGAFDFG